MLESTTLEKEFPDIFLSLNTPRHFFLSCLFFLCLDPPISWPDTLAGYIAMCVQLFPFWSWRTCALQEKEKETRALCGGLEGSPYHFTPSGWLLFGPQDSDTVRLDGINGCFFHLVFTSYLFPCIYTLDTDTPTC